MSSERTTLSTSYARSAGPGVLPRRGTLIATAVSLMLFAAVGLAPVANADPSGHPKNAAVKTYIIKTKTSLAAKGVAVDVDEAGGQIKNRYKRVYPASPRS